MEKFLHRRLVWLRVNRRRYLRFPCDFQIKFTGKRTLVFDNKERDGKETHLILTVGLSKIEGVSSY